MAAQLPPDFVTAAKKPDGRYYRPSESGQASWPDSRQELCSSCRKQIEVKYFTFAYFGVAQVYTTQKK